MDSWDDDGFEVPEIGDNSVKVSWEDEEEEEEEQVAQTSSSTENRVLKPKQIKKMKLKEQEEKRKLNAAIAKERALEMANESVADRKARERKAIEDADYENTLDAFSSGAAIVGTSEEDMESIIKSIQVSNLAEHEKFGDLVGKKVATSNVKYAIEFIKSVLTKSTESMSSDDIKEITTIVNVIKNEKIQAAKPKSKKKKATGKQGYAKVERGGGNANYDDYYNEYDDFM